MFFNYSKKTLAFLLTLMMVFSVMPVQVLAAENNDDYSASQADLITESADQIVFADADAASRALSDTAIQVTAKKTSTFGDFSCTTSGKKITVVADSGLLNQAKGTVTITNKKSSSVVLTFSYSVSGSKASVSGAISGTSGVYNAALAAGASITFTFDSGALNADATLYIDNINAKAIVAGAANVNVIYDSAFGSVSGAGENVGTAGSKITVTATAKAGSKFLAWTDEENMILSKSASYSFTASGNDTLKALFTNPDADAYFAAGNYYHSDLSKAAAAVSTVVLVADGTLGAGNYTIPSGVTVLIPKDDNNTINTNIPDRIDKSDYPTHIYPTAFRTLKMAAGANITVKGNLNVAGTQYAGGTGQVMGGVYGPVGFIRMETGSKITVNNGANLYAWGYIVGSGDIEVLKGGTVYESFQSTDWRGGQASSDLVMNDKNNVFPMTQYYVQNIEVPMKLNAGSTEKGYSCTTVTLAGVQGAEVPFIGAGDDNLFTIDSGYLIKDYDEATDRQVYKAYGNLSMKKIKVSMRVTAFSNVTLDSSKYVLPITNNLTVEMCSGTINITQDLCFLPGSEIIIREGASCNLADGKSVYVYDLSEWGGYVSHANRTFIPLPYAPGRTFTRTALADAKIQIDGTVNASAGYLYTTKSGAVVTSTGTGRVIMKSGTATNTYQISQGIDGDSSATKNVAIPVVVAKLQNADGTTTDPSKEINPKAGTVYTYTDGKWVAKCRNSTCEANGQVSCSTPLPCKYCGQTIKPAHKYASTVTTAATCVMEGLLTYTCSACADTYTEVIPATGVHKYADTVTTPATCTTEGVRTFDCADCDDTYTEVIPATGHTEVTDKAVAPTCTETGLTEGKHCSVCNEVLTAQETVEATGHTVVTDAAVAPTCTVNGKTEGSHCSVCNEVLKAQETVTAPGHTVVIDKAVAATCTENGKTEGSHCSVCNTVLLAQIAVKAPGHTVVKDKAVAATCTETGLTEGSHCSVCNEVLKAQETAEAKGHTIVKDAAVAATCTEAGKTEGEHCSVCNVVLKAQETVAAKGHKYTDSVTTPATCTEEGVRTFKCSACNDSYTEKIASLGGHKLTWTETKAPTAFAEGESTGKCSVCGYTEKKAIAKLLVIDVKPEAKATVKLAESGAVLAIEKTTVSTVLKNVTDNTEIVSKDGKKVAEVAVVTTGMKIVLKNEAGKVVEEKTIIVAGDVDCDGKITAADARAALRRSVNLDEFTDYQENAADVDRNSKVTAADAREILRASVGLVDKNEFYNRNK